MNARDLLRRQLDARLQLMPRDAPPKGGWTRAIRRALGMTMAQLARRLGVSAPSVADLERREADGTISVARLRTAADALGCDLIITFVPRIPLADMVDRQARHQATREQQRLVHTMALENQSHGLSSSSPDAARAVERWLSEPGSRLWDD